MSSYDGKESGKRLTGAARSFVWFVFFAYSLALAWNSTAYDLTATYLAGRMMAHSDAAALYRPVLAGIHWRADPGWARNVADAGLPVDSVTSFVQTPLWAWLIAPLASAIDFAWFKRIFAALTAVATLTMVDAAARQWAPRLLRPGWQAGLLVGLACSTPFLWGVSLGQTHAIFLCLAVLAAVQAARGNDVSAGGLLAATAAVKITPLWLVVTWLVAGRWRPALSFVLFSAAFAALAVLCAGWTVVSDYLATLHAIGGHILLSFNNDSLASFLLEKQLSDATAFQWRPVPLPPWVAVLSLALLSTCAAAGGWMDRHVPSSPGAVLTLVAATAFAPLAWNHYFIVLIIPVMLFLQACHGRAAPLWGGMVVLIAMLDVPPLAYGVGAPLATVALRSHLLAALLCIVAMPILVARQAARQSVKVR